MAATFIEPGSDATLDLSFYNATAGTVASATDQKYTGTRSIKLSTGSPAVTASVTRSNVLIDAGRRISFRFFFDSLPSGNDNIIAINQNGGSVVCNFRLETTGKIGVLTAGGGDKIGNTALVANTWNRICIAYYITSVSVFEFDVYLNGVLDQAVTRAVAGFDLARANSNTIVFSINSGAGANKNHWIDDIYIDDGASSSALPDTGAIRVTAKRPFANGTTNGFTTQIGSGGSGYGSGHAPQVNEQPLSQTNGWSMIGAGSAITEEYNIEGLAVGDVDLTRAIIVATRGWVFAKSAISETGQMVFDGGTSTNLALTSIATFFQGGSGTTYPAGTGTDIGIVTSTTVTTVSLYECGITIAYFDNILLQKSEDRVNFPVNYPIENRTFINELRQQLIGQDTFFGAPGQVLNIDWQNPIFKQNRQYDDLTNRLIKILGIIPFNQYEWNNPQIRQNRQYDNSVNSLITLFRTFPFNQYDWQVPLRILSRADQQIILDLLNTTLKPIIPFTMTDWPNPQRAPTIANLYAVINANTNINPITSGIIRRLLLGVGQ